MADVVANLAFQFSAEDKASPVASKAAKNMDAVAAVMEKSAVKADYTTQTVIESIKASLDAMNGVDEPASAFAKDIVAVGNVVSKFVTTLKDTSITSTEATEALAEFNTGMLALKENMSPAVLQSDDYAAAMENATQVIEKTTKAFAFANTGVKTTVVNLGLLGGTWSLLAGKIGNAGKALAGIKDSGFIKNLGTSVGEVFKKAPVPTFLGTIGKVIGKDMATIGTGITKSVSLMSTGVTKATGLLTMGLKSALGFLSPILDLVTGVFGPAMEQLSDTMSAVLEPISGAILTIVQKLLPSVLQVFEPLMGFVLAGIQRISEVLLAEDSPFLKIFTTLFDVFTKLQPVFDTLMNGIAGYAKTIIPAFEKLVTTLIDVLAPILDTVIKAVVQLYEAIGPLVAELLGALEPILKEIGNVIGVLLKELIPVLMPLLKAVFAIVKPLLPIVVILIKLLSTILVPLIKLLAPLLVYVAKFIELIFTKLGGVLEALAQQMQIGLDIFQNWMKPVLEWISTTWASFFENFDKNMEDVGAWFVSLGVTIKGWVDDVAKWFADLWQGLSDGWEDMKKTVVFIWDNLGTLVSNGFKKILNATLIDPVNAMLKTIKDITIPGTEIKPFDGLPTLQEFAKGGIVSGFESRGGLPAIVGEAGPEAIIPLNKETLQQLAPPVNVTVQGSEESSGLLIQILETQKRMADVLEEYLMTKRAIPVGGR